MPCGYAGYLLLATLLTIRAPSLKYANLLVIFDQIVSFSLTYYINIARKRTGLKHCRVVNWIILIQLWSRSELVRWISFVTDKLWQFKQSFHEAGTVDNGHSLAWLSNNQSFQLHHQNEFSCFLFSKLFSNSRTDRSTNSLTLTMRTLLPYMKAAQRGLVYRIW